MGERHRHGLKARVVPVEQGDMQPLEDAPWSRCMWGGGKRECEPDGRSFVNGASQSDLAAKQDDEVARQRQAQAHTGQVRQTSACTSAIEGLEDPCLGVRVDAWALISDGDGEGDLFGAGGLAVDGDKDVSGAGIANRIVEDMTEDTSELIGITLHQLGELGRDGDDHTNAGLGVRSKCEVNRIFDRRPQMKVGGLERDVAALKPCLLYTSDAADE